MFITSPLESRDTAVKHMGLSLSLDELMHVG